MGNRNHVQKSIYNTLAYADIFGYPLTQEEIWRFLISSNSNTVSKELFVKELLQSPFIFQGKGFFCLQGKESCITKRIHAQTQSKRKYIIATHITRVLSQIPTVHLVGITGGLAMNNVSENDDIDICILVKKNTLWITRLMVLVVLQIFGRRRKRSQQNVSDAICANFFIDVNGMTIAKEKQNVYTAHEVVQMKPIFDRDFTYTKFLAANIWVKKYLPNSLDIKILGYKDVKRKSPNILVTQYLSIFLSLFESFAKKLQLWYMSRQGITGVGDHVLAFFPADYAEKILGEYRKKVAYYAKI